MNTNRISALLSLLVCFATHSPAAVQLDAGSRWQIRDYYNTVYPAETSGGMQWTGDYASGNAGTVSSAWLEATRQRIVFYRTMAGVPADVTFDPEWNAACQQAALMMSAQGQINHYPPASWPWYTPAAANAARYGNLALGSTGPDAVEGYMNDFGAANYTVGHRRWLLFPQSTTMGSGDVPGDTVAGRFSANALWLIPNAITARPATRDPYVAWPPRGHVPYNLVFPRWSFSHPGADFRNTTVTLRKNGQNIPVTLETLFPMPPSTSLVGDPTLVWVPDGMVTHIRSSWPAPVADETITVKLDNVLIGGVARSFEYTVIIFNPGLPGPEEHPVSITSPQKVYATVPANFGVASRDWSEGVQARIIRAEPYTDVHGAEDGLGAFAVTVSPTYNPVQSGRVYSGSSAFRLAQPTPREPQVLTLKDSFIIWPGPAYLSFASSLAFATVDQLATVEINVGTADNWQPIWSRRGPVENNSQFELMLVDLSPWSGLTARFRFRYDMTGNSYYSNTEPLAGWAFDDIQLSGISRVTGIEELPDVWEPGPVDLVFQTQERVYMQVRDIAFGGFKMDWSPLAEINPVAPAPVPAPANQWSQDAILGWLYGAGSGWQYSFAMGWVRLESFPWILTSAGWFRHSRGAVDSGMWLYSPQRGHVQISRDLPGWYLQAPFDTGSLRRFEP